MVTILIMILVITKYLKSYLKALITKKIKQRRQKEQEEFNEIIGVLEDFTPRNNKYIEAKNKLLHNVKKSYEGREKIIEGFKNEIFSFNYDEAYEERMRYEKEEEEITNVRNKNGLIDYEKRMRKIGFKERNINKQQAC